MLLVLFSHPICSTLLRPCENFYIFLPNVNIREHSSYAMDSYEMPELSGPKIGGPNTEH